jgi:hypothetical protein
MLGMPSPHLPRWTGAKGLIFLPRQLTFGVARKTVVETIEQRAASAPEILEAALRDARLNRSDVFTPTVWFRAPNALGEIEAVAAERT